MKKTLRKLMSIMLTVVMLFGIASAGGTFGFSLFGIRASAATHSVGDYIQMGSYPQSRVTDTALLAQLNAQNFTWNSYDYYSGSGNLENSDMGYGTMEQGDWMKYADVNYNGEKYRAVSFTQYRRIYTTLGFGNEEESVQYQNGYYADTVYWFKYEPLLWRILDPTTGLVMCDTVIDSQPYNNTVYEYQGELFQDAEHMLPASYFATSSIHEWLNHDFADNAFNYFEQKNIEYTELEGMVGETQVFLASGSDLANAENWLFEEPYPIKANASDYAKSQGCYIQEDESEYNTFWITRVANSGNVLAYVNENYTTGPVLCTYYGIRPFMRINPEYFDYRFEGSYTYIVQNNQAAIVNFRDGVEREITIPTTLGSYPVTTIKGMAFEDSNVTRVTIPATVTNIEPFAFLGNSVLSEIIVDPNNYVYSSDSDGVVFNKNKTKLVVYPGGRMSYTYSVPSTVKTIGNGAFACVTVVSVILPDGLTTIEGSAFYGWISFYITIPTSVTSIGEAAFSECPLNNVCYKGTQAQWNNINIGADNEPLTSANIRFSTSSIFTYTINNGEVTITGCDSSLSGYAIIPPTIDGYPVTTIGEMAFDGCNGITHLIIPDSVTNVGSGAFVRCAGLERVILGDGMTEIPYGMFSQCTSLRDVTFGSNITSIGEGAFGVCPALTSIEIPDSVTSIGQNAFAMCTALTSITIPDSVTSLGEGAFAHCSYLESVTLGNGITEISNDAFSECYYLNDITFGSNVTTIGEGAFGGCETLSSITIPDGVTSIGRGAFETCHNLIRIRIPDSVISVGENAFDRTGVNDVYYGGTATQWDNIAIDTGNEQFANANIHYSYGVLKYTLAENGGLMIIGCDENAQGEIVIPETIDDSPVTVIGKDAFRECNQITSVIIPNSVTSIENAAFYECGALESVELPSGITEIANHTFTRCYALESIVIPDGVTRIGVAAFAGSGIECMELPESLVNIDLGAFVNCNKLTMVYYHGTQDTWDSITVGEDNEALLNANIRFLCTHPTTEIRNAVQETCGTDGYTGDEYCTECGDLLHEGTVIPKTNDHNYQNGVCTVCHELDEYYNIPALVVDTPRTVNRQGRFYFSFTPETDGFYSFMGVSHDVYGMLYDENMNLICESNDYSDTPMLTKGLTAGKTYYYSCTLDGADAFVPYSVKVVHADVIEVTSGAVIDFENKFIYGLAPGLDSLDGYIEATADYDIVPHITTTVVKFGTGKQYDIMTATGRVIDTYTIVIFGDVNGDGWYDGMDSVLVNCIENGMLTEDNFSKAAYFAADCNFDGVVDVFDTQLLREAGVLLSGIDQSMTIEELQATSAYAEYFELIGQNPNAEAEEPEAPAPTDPTPDPVPEQSIFSRIISFFIGIFTWISKFFK